MIHREESSIETEEGQLSHLDMNERRRRREGFASSFALHANM